jgi:hypothetical protein
MKEEMETLYVEGVAIRNGPEPCADAASTCVAKRR